MTSAARHPVFIGLSITVLVGSFGCAPSRPYNVAPPPHLSEEVGLTLGTIGVVSARYTPAVVFQTPASGSDDGAQRGWAFCTDNPRGEASHSVEEALIRVTWGPPPLPLITLAGLCTIRFSRAVGAVAGGVLAEPAAKVEEVDATLRSTIAALRIQETMRNHVLQVARERTHHQFVLLEEQGPTARGKEVSYRLRGEANRAGLEEKRPQQVNQYKEPGTLTERIVQLLGYDPAGIDRVLSLQDETTENITIKLPEIPRTDILKAVQGPKDQRMDTILEISVPGLGLVGKWCVNPSLSQFMTARIRLIRIVDGKVLRDHTFEYQGKARTFTEWARNNAQPFREELDGAYKSLAATIVARLFETGDSPIIATRSP